ncbi:MAG: hypothetical protein JXA92_09585 [candidate division Zixibacteria bacterium]|nr:hypothetical protein [candidate division Zixibacteria bacterium]
MKKGMIVIGVLLWAFFAVTAAGQTVEKPEQTPIEKVVDTAKKAEEKTEPTLIGEWILNSSKYRTRGSITFKEDSTYSKTEWDPDGIGATIAGEYKTDRSKEPFAINLCLNKCGGPGSEWTTLFGIFRFREDGTVIIITSPDTNQPENFDKEPEMYTMILTRVEKKE